MTLPGDVLRAAATDLPATTDPWGWLTARAHDLDHNPGLPCTEECPYVARLIADRAQTRGTTRAAARQAVLGDTNPQEHP